MNKSKLGIASIVRFLTTISTAALVVLLIAGCNSTGQEAEEASSSIATDGISIDEIEDYEGLFIMSPDGESFEELDEVDLSGYIKNDDEDESESVIYSGNSTYIDVSAGESLILVGSDIDESDLNIERVIEEGYWQGEGTGNLERYSEVDGKDIEGLKDSYEEISFGKASKFFNGYNLELRDVQLRGGSEDRRLFSIDESVVLDAGWYEGTQYQEGAISVDDDYLLTNSDLEYIEAEKYIKRTQDGYFVVDLDALGSDSYVLELHKYDEGSGASWTYYAIDFD